MRCKWVVALSENEFLRKTGLQLPEGKMSQSAAMRPYDQKVPRLIIMIGPLRNLREISNSILRSCSKQLPASSDERQTRSRCVQIAEMSLRQASGFLKSGTSSLSSV